jgi:WD40 repeat protein/nucleoside phosphorylase
VFTGTLLDAYSCEKAFERIGLTPRTREMVQKVTKLTGDDNRVNVEAIHREVYGVPDLNKPQSANAQLNRLLGIINEAAEQKEIPFKACITSDKKVGATKRWVWFEGPLSEAPPTTKEDLDGIGLEQPISQQATIQREKPIIVLMTFNEYETAAVLERFCQDAQPKSETRNGIVYYRLGIHNGADVILAISRQGVKEAQSAAEDACAAWQPDWLIGVGIAFGINPVKQKPGDVLVASSSQDYELQRIESDGTITPRGKAYSASMILERRIWQLDHMKRADREELTWPTIHFGSLLCGEKLIDNLSYRDSLLGLYPGNIIGGEMEALGLAIPAVKPQYRAEWIVVKAICDWADGNKNNPNKKRDQKLAAKNAARVVYETLCCAPLDDSFKHERLSTPLDAEEMGKEKHRLSTIPTVEPDEVFGYIPNRAGDASLGKAAEPSDSVSFGQRGVDIIEALCTWVTQADSQPLFALFGEYGMGKTVTCQRFTKVLEEMREQDYTLPRPLYFNLRNVTGLDQRIPTVEEVMLECAQRNWVLPARGGTVSLEMINQYLEQGAVVIFDGLDEVLAKLTGSDGEVFTRNLLSLLDKVKIRQEKTGGLPLKILLSSRTQYFRTLRDERSHLTGNERGNKGEDAFQAMLLLPFDDKQVRQYLLHFISESEMERTMELIREVNNLEELTHRPYTLSFVARQLPSIKRARAEGRTVNGATIYREMVRSWLDRDDHKHNMKPWHKLLLASHLAARLWKARASSIPVDNLEEWLHDWLEAQPEIRRRCEKLVPSLLEEDLRNTTFLSRIDRSANDSSYRFAHTSLQEFFLAEFLVDAVRKNEPQLWEAGPSQEEVLCPSAETLDFMGQILAEEGDHELIETLESWVRVASTSVNTIILHYTLQAVSRNYPYPQLQGIQLPGAELSNLHIPREYALDLSGANLIEASLRGTRIAGCNLRGAKLSGADLFRTQVLECDMGDTDLDGAKLPGTIFRRVNLAGADGALPELHRTQFLWCKGLSQYFENSQDVLIAPLSGQGVRSQELMAQARLRSFLGHSGPVSSVVFSPDGAALASGGGDSIIRLWDVQSGKCTATLKGHSGPVSSVAFSPDGATLASGGGDSIIRLWDVQSGKCTATLEGHSNRVSSVAFSPDGAALASGGSDGIKLWDVQSGRCTAILEGHSSSVNSVVFSPDGTTLASGGDDIFYDDSAIKLWDVQSGRCTATLKDHSGGVISVVFSPDGTTLALGGGDNIIRLWDVQGGRCTVTLEGHSVWVNSVVFSPDGTTLASGGDDIFYDDSAIKLWDVQSGRCIATLKDHSSGVSSVVFSPDGTILASGGDDSAIKLWDVQSGRCTAILEGHSNRVSSVVFSPDGTTLASGGDDHTVKLWDIQSGRCAVTLEGHNDWVRSITVSPDGAMLASGGAGGTIRLWDVRSGRCTATLEGHNSSVNSVAFSSDGVMLASGDDDGPIGLWDVRSGRCTATLDDHNSRANSVAFSPDGAMLASGDFDRNIRLWDVRSNKCVVTFESHNDWVSSLAFSPDSAMLVSGDDDGPIRLWDVRSGRCTATLEGHSDWVSSLAFSPDGVMLASGGAGGTIRLWDVRSGRCAVTLEGHNDWVRSVAFSPDGATLASSGDNGTIRLWDVQSGVCRKIEIFPTHQYAVWNEDDTLRFASEDAWEYLGWQVPGGEGETVHMLPAETFGALPLPPAR